MKTITDTIMLDPRPIQALQLGDPGEGNFIAVGPTILALMPYKEDDGRIWIAIIGPSKNAAMHTKREEIKARMALTYVSNIVYAPEAKHNGGRI